MSIAKIQSGDTVKVTSGNFKGSVGTVIKVTTKTYPNGLVKTRASVSGLPKIAKYRKAQSYQGQNYPGAKLDVDRSINISNLSLFDEKNKLAKVKIEISKDGKKTRLLKTSGSVVTKIKQIKEKAVKNEIKQLESSNK